MGIVAAKPRTSINQGADSRLRPLAQEERSEQGLTGQNNTLVPNASDTSPASGKIAHNSIDSNISSANAPGENRGHSFSAGKKPAKDERSFAYRFYENGVKTLWKVLSGNTLTEIVKGCLKDQKNTVSEVIYSVFCTDFISRVGADFLGAWAEDITDGKTKIFGMTIPKVDSWLSSMVASSGFVNFWRAMSAADDINTMSADKGMNDDDKQLSSELKDHFKTIGWMKYLRKVQGVYKTHVNPFFNKIFALTMGIKPPVKNEEGEKIAPPSINKWQFFGVIGLTGVLASKLRKDVQVHGMRDIAQSQGLRKVWETTKSYIGTLIPRLNNYIFKNLVTMHPRGYGYDACVENAVGEKFLVPAVQIAVDNFSAIMSSFTGINGVMISSIVKILAELPVTFLTAHSAGIAKKTRIPEHWMHLSQKFWEPAKVAVISFLTPLFRILKPIYKFLGFMPSQYDGRYRKLDQRISKPVEGYEHISSVGDLWRLFFRSYGAIPQDLINLFYPKKDAAAVDAQEASPAKEAKKAEAVKPEAKTVKAKPQEKTKPEKNKSTGSKEETDASKSDSEPKKDSKQS